MLKLIHRSELLKYIGDAKTILDVGCGDKPLPIATCIADKFPDTHESGGKKFTENPRGQVKRLKSVPFVEATLPDLPFRDNEFDFVFCSHVIEHVDDMEASLRTLTRIAPRGYLECPRAWFEYVDGTPFHKWMIDFDGKNLLVKKKTEAEFKLQLERRLYDEDRKAFDRMYRTQDVNCIRGVEDNWRKRLRSKVQRALKPRVRNIARQEENKTFTNLCLYWEKDIPFQVLPSSAYLV